MCLLGFSPSPLSKSPNLFIYYHIKAALFHQIIVCLVFGCLASLTVSFLSMQIVVVVLFLYIPSAKQLLHMLLACNKHLINVTT
jgi:hypothetical protein